MNRHQRRAAARQSDTRIAIQFVSGLELLERAARREDLAGTVVAFCAAMVSTRQLQCVLCPTPLVTAAPPVLWLILCRLGQGQESIARICRECGAADDLMQRVVNAFELRDPQLMPLDSWGHA